MVVGFCLLISKRLLERIGGLDEGFGQGNYEDTDFCLRALLAGFNPVVALVSFVHHFGSRSFVAGKVDYARQIQEKQRVFRRKWQLPGSEEGVSTLNLEQLLMLGFQTPLHFHILPEGSGVRMHALQAWEEERWVQLGEVYFGKGGQHEAECILRAVRERDPASSRAANNLACTLWQSERDEYRKEAVQVLQDLLVRNPETTSQHW